MGSGKQTKLCNLDVLKGAAVRTLSLLRGLGILPHWTQGLAPSRAHFKAAAWRLVLPRSAHFDPS